MSGSSHSVEIRDLLAHADWIRGLARRLVANASQADDVVQETWVAAVQRPPAHGQNPRGWLAQVARNTARQLGRGEVRRARREHDASRPEGVPCAAELTQRAALQRDVVGHVLALEEPLRSVVLLRFFEGLAPGEIAGRLELPAKTVYGRLERALDRLRERLDGEYGGDRRAWCSALLPLAAAAGALPGPVGGSLLSRTGGWIVNVNAKIGVALAVVLAGGLGLWRSLDPGRAEAPQAPVREQVVSAAALREPDLHTESLGQRVLLEHGERAPSEPFAAAPETPPAPGELRRIRGRAVDVRGAALNGVALALVNSPQRELCVTAADGCFEFDIEEPGPVAWRLHSDLGSLRVVESGLITLRQSCLKETNLDEQHIVVAAPVRRLEGTVVDPAQRPIESALVSLSPQSQGFRGFPYPLDMTRISRLRERSDDRGNFGFERFPDAPGLRLHVSADGYEAQAFELDRLQEPFLLELTPIAESQGPCVRGVVLDEERYPVEGALVKLGFSETRSDEGGHFRLNFEWIEASVPICAAKEGMLPALIPNFGRYLESHDDAVPPVELVLGGEPLEMRGRVVDADGAACHGWRVLITDETTISHGVLPVTTAEELTRGDRDAVFTNREGEFELRGLLERDYRILAFDRKTLSHAVAMAPAGGHGVVLRASGALRSDVHGRILTLDGRPVPRVQIQLQLETVVRSYGSSSESGSDVLTDEEGRFAFPGVPREDILLALNSENIIPMRFRLPEEESSDGFEIVVYRRCHFRIEPDDPSALPEFVELQDDQGNRLQVNSFQANGMSAFPFVFLRDGHSEVLSVSEQASVAVLKRGEVEISRHPVQLDPEGVNLLRF